jgi:asparagine synthase (glutamine-hydrolysing)
MDSWVKDGAGVGWVSEVLSPESIARTGYFDYPAVAAARKRLAAMRPRSPGKTGLEMGLTAVVATQLWHHLHLGGGLCGLGSSSPEGG